MAEYVVDFSARGNPPQADGRLDAPAFHRNHAPIWSVLAPHLTDAAGDLLEIGSGTGQHVAMFAAQTPRLTWWPSDLCETHRRSTDAWACHAGLSNVRPALRLDIADADWRTTASDNLPTVFRAMLCINVLHIAPWEAAQGLIRCAGETLASAGQLFVYGPFMRDGQHTAPSNAAFDASLRQGNPEWGVRDTADLATLAERHGLHLARIMEMPANNLVLVFERKV